MPAFSCYPRRLSKIHQNWQLTWIQLLKDAEMVTQLNMEGGALKGKCPPPTLGRRKKHRREWGNEGQKHFIQVLSWEACSNLGKRKGSHCHSEPGYPLGNPYHLPVSPLLIFPAQVIHIDNQSVLVVTDQLPNFALINSLVFLQNNHHISQQPQTQNRTVI